MTLDEFVRMYQTVVAEQCSEWLELHKRADIEESKQMEELKKVGYSTLSLPVYIFI